MLDSHSATFLPRINAVTSVSSAAVTGRTAPQIAPELDRALESVSAIQNCAIVEHLDLVI